MPLISHSSYHPPYGLSGGHLQTIYPTLFRKVPYLTQERERIDTHDGDFIDLDWARHIQSDKLAILTHGLEGSSHSIYMRGMAQALIKQGWHVLSWNFRSCSGEANRKLHSYHSGSTNDLETVIRHADTGDRYADIALIGFSLGGNITLKWLGDRSDAIDPKIKAAITFSVATDLASSAVQLERFENRIYMHRFMKTLRQKVRDKIQQFPGQLSDDRLNEMRTFRQFDGAYTAPLNGFSSAADYWQQCSSGCTLDRITIPTLLVNAENDPFLTPQCFPRDIARTHRHFHLETPRSGGHMGFIQFNQNNQYWSEQRTVEFLDNSSKVNSALTRKSLRS